ncbi:hypothetical protein D9758_002303 [Tetrapyrgos nigripes]|uniref:Novel STAND NTPase 1 domain-containing protein n=1 Tax=Tetrapyrgos nigripes TaxID=182062 RepID=A0A8H5GPE5_9AGAR|nr:hypothetical protein D9758_002303 [Tetrapyrgos nigripes]
MSSLCGCWPSKPKVTREEDRVSRVSPLVQRRKDDIGKPSNSEMAADAILSALEVVSENIPIPAVGVAVKAAIRLIELCQQVRASLEQADELRERIRGLSLVLVQGLSGKPLGEITDNLKRDIEQLQDDLQYIEEKLTEISNQHRLLLVLFKNTNEEAVKKCLKKLDGSLSNFALARQVQNATDLKKLENDIEAYYRTLQATLGNTEEIRKDITEVKTMLQNFNPEFRQEIQSTTRKPHPPPRSHIFYGRDEVLNRLATRLVPAMCETGSKVLLALLGPGGIGKTSAALAVMEHDVVQERYGGESNQFWVGCAKATSTTLLLDILYDSLCINKKTGQTLEDILAELRPPSSKPEQQPYRLLLLDNFETPWNADEEEVERILRNLADIPRLSILITMRANQPPTDQKWEVEVLKPVDVEASAKIYTKIYPDTSEEQLFELLDAIGHLPLAVTLLANYARTSQTTPVELLRNWRRDGPDILSMSDDDEDNVMHKSIKLSLDNPLMKKSTHAMKVLTLLAFFPTPVSRVDLEKYWVPEGINQSKALHVLSKTALVELTESTAFVIPVIRSYILRHTPDRDFVAATRVRIHRVCCSLIADHGSSPGDPTYLDDKQFLSSQEVNLQSVLLDATSESSADVSPEILQALLTLSWHQRYTRPRSDLIEHTLSVSKRMKNAKYEAESLVCSAEMCRALCEFNVAIERVSRARGLFNALGDRESVARCFLKLIEYDLCKPTASQDSLENFLCLVEEARIAYGADDPFGQALCDLWHGQIYNHHGMLLEAHPMLERARAKFEELGRRLELERCLSALALSYRHLYLQQPELVPNSLAIALHLTNQALELSIQCGRGDYQSHNLHCLAITLKYGRLYDEALGRALEFLTLAKLLGDALGVGDALKEIGDILSQIGDWINAEIALQKALVAYEGIPASLLKDYQIRNCRILLYQVERTLNDMESMLPSR